jgi:hypothetical protein
MSGASLVVLRVGERMELHGLVEKSTDVVMYSGNSSYCFLEYL